MLGTKQCWKENIRNMGTTLFSLTWMALVWLCVVENFEKNKTSVWGKKYKLDDLKEHEDAMLTVPPRHLLV